MARFEALESCSDLSSHDADDALASLDSLKALLARCAAIARNGEGVVRVLHVVARLARGDAPWLEGDVRAELEADGEERTILALYTDLGFGLRERLTPPTTFPVAFEELARAVSLAPTLIEPLEARQEDKRLVLGRGVSEQSVAPPAIEIGNSSRPERPSANPTANPAAGSLEPPSSGREHEATTVPPAESAPPHTRPTQRVSLGEIKALLAETKGQPGPT